MSYFKKTVIKRDQKTLELVAFNETLVIGFHEHEAEYLNMEPDSAYRVGYKNATEVPELRESLSHKIFFFFSCNFLKNKMFGFYQEILHILE